MFTKHEMGELSVNNTNDSITIFFSLLCLRLFEVENKLRPHICSGWNSVRGSFSSTHDLTEFSECR